MLLAACLLQAVQARELLACAAQQDNPPFLFSNGDIQQQFGLGNQEQGLAIRVMAQIFADLHQSPPKVIRMPWQRCLKQAAIGEFDLVINVPTAQIDPAPFLITEAFAEVHSVYFYSKRRFSGGLRIGNLEDLKRYRVCGLHGNRFESYGIRTEQVDSGSKDLPSLIRKTQAGYCDLFIDKQEIISALITRQPELAEPMSQLNSAPLPEESPLGMHFAISRQTPNAQALQNGANRTILNLQRSGQLQKWYKEYLQ